MAGDVFVVLADAQDNVRSDQPRAIIILGLPFRKTNNEIWEKLGLAPSVRGEKLTLEQFAELSNLIDQTISETSKI